MSEEMAASEEGMIARMLHTLKVLCGRAIEALLSGYSLYGVSTLSIDAPGAAWIDVGKRISRPTKPS